MSTAAAHYGAADTRRRILDAAWALLERRGSGFTLADVATGAAVSRQAVYLHFGDRSRLLVALVDHIDESLGRDRLRTYIHDAPSGVEGLRRWVEAMSWYTAKIDRVTEVLEAGQQHDPAQAAAWRDRMNGRHNHVRRIMARVYGERRLAPEWTVDAAAELAYALTMPSPWRELTRQCGWSAEEYAAHVWRLLARGLLTEESPASTT